MATNYANDANCQGAWLFDDDLTDESGEGNTLTDNGSIAYSTTRPDGFTTGKSAQFDGSSDYLTRAYADLSANFPGKVQKTDMSLAFWIKRSNTTNETIVLWVKGSGGGGHEVYMDDSNGEVTIRLADEDYDYWSQAFAGALHDTDWHHIAVVFEGASPNGTATIYMSSESAFGDEVEQGYTATNVENILNHNSAFGLGAKPDGTLKLTGYIYQPIIFDDALSAAEVEEIYDYGITGADGDAGGSIIPMVSYYKRRRMFWMGWEKEGSLWLPTI